MGHFLTELPFLNPPVQQQSSAPPAPSRCTAHSRYHIFSTAIVFIKHYFVMSVVLIILVSLVGLIVIIGLGSLINIAVTKPKVGS